MKFTALAVFLVLSWGANPSVNGPIVLGSPTGPASIKTTAPPALVDAPGIVKIVPRQLPIFVPVQIVVGDGTFAAKTGGPAHVGPLLDHKQTVVSANMKPAPGTI